MHALLVKHLVQVPEQLVHWELTLSYLWPRGHYIGSDAQSWFWVMLKPWLQTQAWTDWTNWAFCGQFLMQTSPTLVNPEIHTQTWLIGV